MMLRAAAFRGEAGDGGSLAFSGKGPSPIGGRDGPRFKHGLRHGFGRTFGIVLGGPLGRRTLLTAHGAISFRKV